MTKRTKTPSESDVTENDRRPRRRRGPPAPRKERGFRVTLRPRPEDLEAGIRVLVEAFIDEIVKNHRRGPVADAGIQQVLR